MSENVATSSQSLVPAGVIPQPYKCLLIQHAQNVWKQKPVYQSVNEGSGHGPKFRCTVTVDGVSYTSPDTFQRRKMAERDASRIAYYDLLQKLKNEALCLVCEDKSLYKSIMGDFAAKMYMEKPAYQTAHLNPHPVFRSSLVFGDVSCKGDYCGSKKGAEQSVARAVILKYIDSESGIKLSEIIKSKYKQYTKMMDSQSVYNNANAVVQHGTLNGHSNSLETGPSQEVSTPTLTSATSVPTVFAHAPLAGTLNVTNEVVHTGTVFGRINNLETVNIQEVSTSALTPAITAPTILAESPLTGTVNGTCEVLLPETVNGHKVYLTVAQTPFTGTHSIPTSSIISAPSLGQVAIVPASHTSVPAVSAHAPLAGTLNGTNEVVQTGTVFGRTNSLETVNIQKVSTPALTPAITAPTILAESPLTGTANGTCEVLLPEMVNGHKVYLTVTQTPFTGTHSIPTSSIISAPSVGQVAIVPASHTSSLENSDNSPVMVNPFSVSFPAVAQTNSVGSTSGKKPNCKTSVPTYTIPAPSLGQVAIPVTNSSNVVQLENSEASLMTLYSLPALSPAVAQTNVVGTTSSKKRSCNIKRTSQKKTRADIEWPIADIPLNQVPPFSVQ